MAEKAAFKKAISEGNSVKPANQSKTFDTPVQRNN